MKIEEATPGTPIIERHKQATRKMVVGQEVIGGRLFVVTVNATGRRTKIKATNIGRYDIADCWPNEREETT